MQPASVVEYPGFQRFVNMLDPHYDMPSQRMLMRRLPTKYDEIRQQAMKVLTQVKYVSLTTDIFLTVTVHFIHSWKLKVWYLLQSSAVQSIPESTLQVNSKESLIIGN